jgi:hypothetical protein
MKDYVNAMYSYLLDIDLYFKGNDEETINIIKELKKKLDEYVKHSDLDKLSEVEKAFQEFCFGREYSVSFLKLYRQLYQH